MPTATIDEPEIIWEANRGGQWAFLSCPYWECLADGDRGGGKSAALIACFLSYVGVGFGMDWRGVIFRMTYPELGDIVSRSYELIMPAYPGATYNKSDHEWTFPDGEKLLFRHLDNLKAYDHYHGHSFCLAEGERIVLDKGLVPINEVKVGDLVLAPGWFRRINRVYKTGVKQCVLLSLFDASGRQVSSQVQSADHRVFTQQGWSALSAGRPTPCLYLSNPDSALLLNMDDLHEGWIPHPYGKDDIELRFPLSHGTVVSEPWGRYFTYDIEVEGDNCYFGESGLLSQNCFIGFDELTTWPTHEPYEAMLSCSRPTSSKPGMPLMVRSTTNSFGVGFSWVKSRFVIGKKPNIPYGEPGMERIRIPIRWRDNRHFVESDPQYHSRLASTITNEGQRKAWLENSWDIISGGRFSDVFRESIHVMEPFNIPQAWRLDRSFDWGSSAPFCTLWYAESNGESIPDGRSWPKGTLFVIHEDYGCQGDMLEPGWKPNVGLGLGPVEIAKRTKDHEAKLREWGLISKQPQPGPADDPMFDVSRGRSMASMMADLGLVWMKPSKGPGSRITGWQILEDKLKASMQWPMEQPGIFFFDTCRHLIRTLPAAQRDPKKIEDIDMAEDHALDSLRYRLISYTGGSILHGVSL